MTSLLDDILSSLEEVSGPDGQGLVTAPCPLHDDQSDTLYLSPEHGWRCSRGGRGSLSELALRLGVGLGGNAANEIMRIDPARIADLTNLDRFPLSDVGNAAVFAHLYGERVRFLHQAASGGRGAGDWHIWDGVRWPRDDTQEVVRLASEVWRARGAAAARMTDHKEAGEAFKWSKSTMSSYNIRSMLDSGCPTWLRFLDEIFQGDAEIIRFIQRLVGCALTGVPADHLVICFGAGRNGKSTLIGTIQGLLGDYAAQAQVSTLMRQRAETIRNDLARLFGKRFIGALEQAEGWHLDEGLVKQLTGGDRLVARALYHEHEEQVPTFKIWVGVNDKPQIRDTGVAMWERVFLVPFEAFFPRGKADPDMLKKLQLELAGILNWAIDGCLAWQKQGLNPPESVKAATAEYREESDVISRFVEDECSVGESQSVGATMLYDHYVGWCRSSGQRSMSQTAFGRRLRERGYKKDSSSGRVVYYGIGLRIKF